MTKFKPESNSLEAADVKSFVDGVLAGKITVSPTKSHSFLTIIAGTNQQKDFVVALLMGVRCFHDIQIVLCVIHF